MSRLVQAGGLEAIDVGSWWSTDGQHEIDIVGMRSRPTFVGSVKWRAALLGRDVYNNLADHAHALGVDDAIPWILVGRGGVERSLLKAMPTFVVSRQPICIAAEDARAAPNVFAPTALPLPSVRRTNHLATRR